MVWLAGVTGVEVAKIVVAKLCRIDAERGSHKVANVTSIQAGIPPFSVRWGVNGKILNHHASLPLAGGEPHRLQGAGPVPRPGERVLVDIEFSEYFILVDGITRVRSAYPKRTHRNTFESV